MMKFVCKDCNKEFDAQDEFLKHREEKHNAKGTINNNGKPHPSGKMTVTNLPQENDCPACHQKILGGKVGLEQHMKAKHPRWKPEITKGSVPVLYGDVAKTTWAGMPAPKEAVTIEEIAAALPEWYRTSTCPYCKTRLKSIGQLKDHVLTSHPTKPMLKLNSKELGWVRRINSSKANETKKGAECCPICHQFCLNYGSWKTHLRTVHPGEWKDHKLPRGKPGAEGRGLQYNEQASVDGPKKLTPEEQLAQVERMNKELADKWQRAEHKVEDLKGQMDHLNNLINEMDAEILSLKAQARKPSASEEYFGNMLKARPCRYSVKVDTEENGAIHIDIKPEA